MKMFEWIRGALKKAFDTDSIGFVGEKIGKCNAPAERQLAEIRRDRCAVKNMPQIDDRN